jgi:hypothetical protein
VPESLSTMFDSDLPAVGATYRYSDGVWVELPEPSADT